MALFGVCLFQCRYTLTQARALRWSMGLMGTGPAHLVRGAQQRTHVARSVQASREPRSNPFLAPRARALTGVRARGVACVSCRRASASHGTGATAADRGTARCGRRALRPEQGRGRFNNPRVRSPPASFATAPAKRCRTEARCMLPGQGGRAHALAPAPTTPFVL